MKTAFEEWHEGYDLYGTNASYGGDCFYGGMQYAIDLINASMPPEIGDAIGEAVREKISRDIK